MVAISVTTTTTMTRWWWYLLAYSAWLSLLPGGVLYGLFYVIAPLPLLLWTFTRPGGFSWGISSDRVLAALAAGRGGVMIRGTYSTTYIHTLAELRKSQTDTPLAGLPSTMGDVFGMYMA